MQLDDTFSLRNKLTKRQEPGEGRTKFEKVAKAW